MRNELLRQRLLDEHEATSPSASESVVPAVRGHASDRVFRTLSAEILKGKLKANALLPRERDLADRFGVSRIVVREALHRLKQYELVLVNHGHRTIVLDPDRATNAHLLGLESEVLSSNVDWVAAFAERQIHSAAGLLALAEQRIEPQQVELLDAITERLAQGRAQNVDGEWFEYTRMYWMTIAMGTKNRFYLRDTAWHFKFLERHPHFWTMCTWPPEHRAAYHRRINAKLRERQGAAAAYLEMVRQLRLRAEEDERGDVGASSTSSAASSPDHGRAPKYGDFCLTEQHERCERTGLERRRPGARKAAGKSADRPE